MGKGKRLREARRAAERQTAKPEPHVFMDAGALSASMPSWELKLARARMLTREFEARANEWTSTIKPLEWKQEIAGADVVVSAWTTAAPPPILGLLAGDAAHNYRSALDHLAFALCMAGAGGTLDEKEARRIQFPIRREAGGDAWPGSKYVSEAVAAAIEALQPHHEQEPLNNPLAWVSEFDNHDKHRVLSLTVLGMQGIGIGGPGDNFVIDGPMTARAGMPLTDTPREFMRYPAQGLLGQMTVQLVAGVSFAAEPPGYGREVLPMLDGIASHVMEQVFPALTSHAGR